MDYSARMRLLGIAIVALLVASAAHAKCRDGKTATADTAGHCCWPGQVWNNEKCIGTPTSCPTGFVTDADTQSCKDNSPKRDSGCGDGMVSVKVGNDSHCCWPGQAWSTTRRDVRRYADAVPVGYGRQEHGTLHGK